MTTKTIYLPTLYIDEETGEILEKNITSYKIYRRHETIRKGGNKNTMK